MRDVQASIHRDPALQKIADLFLGFLRLLLGVALLLSVVLICANAFGRYVLHAPVIWAEEVLGYSLVWMVYLGAVLVTAGGYHLRMDLFVQLLGEKAQVFLRLIGNLVFIAVAALIVYQAPLTIAEFSHHSQVANLPMDVVHTVIPFSFVAIICFLVAQSIADIRLLTRGGGPSAADTPA
jgi:TRAP-type C4-dicarboxylate transport system permease small subunit